ncbi:hypothetical protein HRG_012516 [Hirsutella rhossiliensis]
MNPTTRQSPRPSWESSHTAKKEIAPALQPRRFEATLKYNESHMLYRPVTYPQYVGDPSPEIDKAWDELVGPVTLLVSPEEKKLFPGADLFLDPETGLHLAQLTVMHDLHCLNMLRMSRHLDYYTEMDDYTLQPHIEHCIDSLRLSLMCTGDMTLLPVEWSANRNWLMPVFESVHTCRDFGELKAWAKNRDGKGARSVRENSQRYRKTGGFQPRR